MSYTTVYINEVLLACMRARMMKVGLCVINLLHGTW